MPDPSLKAAAEEIKAIITKYDCGAIVFLGSPTHSEFLYHLAPTWSCIVQDGELVRFRSKLSDYADKATQKKHIEESLGLLMGLESLCAIGQRNMASISENIGKHFGEVQHWNRLEP